MALGSLKEGQALMGTAAHGHRDTTALRALQRRQESLWGEFEAKRSIQVSLRAAPGLQNVCSRPARRRKAAHGRRGVERWQLAAELPVEFLQCGAGKRTQNVEMPSKAQPR